MKKFEVGIDSIKDGGGRTLTVVVEAEEWEVTSGGFISFLVGKEGVEETVFCVPEGRVQYIGVLEKFEKESVL